MAPPHDGGQPEPASGTPALVAHQRASAFAPPGSSRFAQTGAPDGQPLWYDQNPRLLHAAHTGGLALDNLLVLGDVETLYFERWSDRSGSVPETWHRIDTTAVEGRLQRHPARPVEPAGRLAWPAASNCPACRVDLLGRCRSAAAPGVTG